MTHPKFTPEQREQARQTMELRRAEFAGQTISIPPYAIQRLDEYNWQIQGPKLRKDGNYYLHLIDALAALPITLLDAEAKGTLALVLAYQKGTLAGLVSQAISTANKLGLLRGAK